MLESWLATWHGSMKEPSRPQQRSAETREFQGWLREADPGKLEIILLVGLISHQIEAVDHMRQCATAASHDELKQLCVTEEAAFKTEGRQLERMLCTWHRDCVSRAFPPY